MIAVQIGARTKFIPMPFALWHALIQSNHLRRKLLEAFSPAACIPPLNEEVAPLLVAVFTEALEQRVIKAFFSVGDKSHVPNFARLLRERIERPSRRATDEGNEISPFHEVLRAEQQSVCVEL
jgi:hypothetical protein